MRPGSNRGRLRHPERGRARRGGVGEDALRRDFAGRGLRLTAPRRLILGAVRATESHPTAEWVHAEVRRRLPRVSLGTVYRNLRLLAAEGLLAEIRQGGSLRFDARVDRHHHFTCERCRRIFDLAEPMDRRLDARVAARTGFRISHHRIEFYGFCAGCAAGRGRGAPRRGRPVGAE
jgi:Fur family transcriptional regulator, peroxide stress response regulator